MSTKAGSEFASEALERLGAFRDQLENLPLATPNTRAGLTAGLFRSAHSLKGLASLFGHNEFASVVEKLEDALDEARLGQRPLDAPATEMLNGCAVYLQEAVRNFSSGADPAVISASCRRAAESLARLVPASAATDHHRALELLELSATERRTLSEQENSRLAFYVEKNLSLVRLELALPLSTLERALKELQARTAEDGELIALLPAQRTVSPSHMAFDALVGGADEPSLLKLARDVGAQVRPLVSASEPVDLGHGSTDDAESIRAAFQSVRVDIESLDAMMQRLSELLVTRAQLRRICDSLLSSETGGARGIAQTLVRQTEVLERGLQDLKERLLDARMVPVGQVFDRLARNVRRMIRTREKAIDFAIEGGDVELDKLIVEELSDPLMHLVRNAIDHGIEAAADRRNKGKPERGTIRLVARQLGNQVELLVSDDGRGIDFERARQVAVERGLLTAEDASILDEHGLKNLIFSAGFSTRDAVSELSGRGVGLDVVKDAVDRSAGVIDVTSRRGEGTTFRITLPLTLAVLRALLVKVGPETYAVPLSSVVEVVPVDEAQLRRRGRATLLPVRNDALAYSDLRSLLRAESPVPPAVAVVVRFGAERMAFAVDAALRQADIVVKPLSGRLRRVPGVAGVAESGDDRLMVVLDMGALMQDALRGARVVA